MCFDATSSLVAGGCAYGVAAFLLRRDHPRLRWGAVALMGITAMQWAEGLLWLSGPEDCDGWNRALTVAVIPLALLAQAWGPLFGSALAVPVRPRRLLFSVVALCGLVTVLVPRLVHRPICSQVTPQGYLNWWSPENPPDYPLPVYAFWALVIGAPFLMWWRPFGQALLIVSWGWAWAVIAWLLTDNAASTWCFFVVFYAAFMLLYALMLPREGDGPGRSA